MTANDESRRLAETFASKLALASGATANAGTVMVGEHSLSLRPEVEQVASAPDGHVFAGVKVSCKIDGEPVDALTAGSVGIDWSRDAALVTAAEDWAMQYGKPIVDALSAKAPALHSGGQQARGPR